MQALINIRKAILSQSLNSIAQALSKQFKAHSKHLLVSAQKGTGRGSLHTAEDAPVKLSACATSISRPM
jgi:hypothetical protein